MAKKLISKASSLQPAKTPPRRPKKPKAQFPVPIVEFAANNSVLNPMEAINGTEAKLTLPAGATDCTFFIAIKDQAEPAFEPIFVDDGDDVVQISARLLSLMIGHTVLMWYTALAGAKEETSLVLELEVQLLREEDLVVSRAVFKHSKNEWNTWWLRMQSFTGDGTLEVKAWPFIFPGQRLFITVAGNQHTAPYRFIWVALDYVVQPHEAHGGYVFRFPLSRPWMSRLDDNSALTAHFGLIWDGTRPVFPQPDDPLLENPLPINAQDFHLRTTTLLQVDPYQDLNPAHLRESVELPSGHWQVNPTNTVKGGHAVVNYAGMAEGDLVCAQARGPNYGPIALGCQTVKAGESSLSFDVPPKVFAALFNKTLTLDYTLQFNNYAPQSSPQRDVDVLAPQLPGPDIEEATAGTVDLSTFVGDATGIVPIFDYAAEGQCCWMWVSGKLENGSVYQFDVLVDESLTADWVGKGVNTPISRAQLTKLADCSEFQLHFAVGFDGKCNRATAFEFPTQGFKIEQAPLVLLEPKVTEAVLDQLTAYNGRNGVHVEVSYVGNNPKHTISVCWKRPNGSCWLLTPQPGSTTGAVVWLLPPEAVIESMGNVVEISFTVTTACKVQTSPSLNLKISLPVRLEMPNVLEATPPKTQNAVLDLRTFTGNANSLEEPMWFLREGQNSWLRADGTDKNGNPYSFNVYSARAITAAEETAGVAGPVLRPELDKLMDATPLMFTFSLSTDGSANVNVVCPSRMLVVKTNPLYDFTPFTGGDWNGWQPGPAAYRPVDLLMTNLGGNWVLVHDAADTRTGELVRKRYDGLAVGQSYEFSIKVQNRNGYPPVPTLSLQATDGTTVLNVTAPTQFPGWTWVELKGSFQATASTMWLSVYTHRSVPAGGDGDDYNLDEFRVRSL
ncbi:hypothetical protein SAMN04490182_3624 [Pseudomonas cedrina]|uniref:CBM-cenC domain-containing protein n=2 Tax=Pseudomonas cedrina TaxID=651740 RepID=A0A1V2K490_PSECE|nr:hypothetical protein [Pseudomonas cedrina]ONH52254.1 hypothetical protein BLL36_19430 [Pseudomonas cedrina subsp. cedrina]SDT20688.1 hypothetical protein SAMN04490182_3624 [Pseudomonas cedrina]